MKDQHTTEVVFRVWTKDSKISNHKGTVIALFPYEFWTKSIRYCTSYEHVGQHGAADYDGILEFTRLAKESEYKDLKTELESMGYNLKPISRVNRNKVAKAYYAR